jgi:hypothetical protein
MDISFEIENIRINNFNRKIKNELDYLKNKDNLNIISNSSDQNIAERIELLEKILLESIEMPNKKEESLKQKKDNLFTEIDKYTYKKQWNKLPSFHKIVKLKEFVKQIYGEGDFQDELCEELSLYANEGKINTKKYVIYDPNLEKILSIPVLVVDLLKKTYQLKIV